VLLTWSCTLLCHGALLGVLVRSVGALSASRDVGGMLLSSMGALVPGYQHDRVARQGAAVAVPVRPYTVSEIMPNW
jgi:hypothetical protein